MRLRDHLSRAVRASVHAHLPALVLIASCGGASGTPTVLDPPEIALVRFEPGNGEIGVLRNRVVRIYFSEPVQPESVDDQSILVRTGGTFQTRPEGTFVVTGDMVEFDPTVTANGGPNALGFPAGAQIAIQVPLKTSGDGRADEEFLRNIEGNPIAVASVSNVATFVTGTRWADPVPGPPGILGLEFTPGPDNLGRISPSAAVTVVFDEPIDPATFRLGKNIFLTNDTATAPASIYQQDVPSLVVFDASLTRYTLQPVFGYGQGPYRMLVSFIDPAEPSTFRLDGLPADLGGEKLGDFRFTGGFETLFDPDARVFGLIQENFLATTKRDQPFTDALWGNDPEFPFALVGQPIVKRNQRVNIAAIATFGLGRTAIDNTPCTTPGCPTVSATNIAPGEEDYCPTQNPLVGPDSRINQGSPPASAGRRQLNLYRQAELGAAGTVVRVAWGPDSDATFAATYPGLILRLGHKRKDTELAGTLMFNQFDVDGFVTVVNGKNYSVPQAFDVNGGATNDGYLDWPLLDLFFDYDGKNDLLLDVEAAMGNTFQTFRTFLAVDPVSVCSCFNLPGCIANSSTGRRQMDSTYGANLVNPAPSPGIAQNPAPFVNVMEFEVVKLRSDARSLYHDSASAVPDYLSPIVTPLVQDGGATIEITWSASSDGIVEDVPFTPNINACDGHRYIRWHCRMRSNVFTGGRPRLEHLQVPFVVP